MAPTQELLVQPDPHSHLVQFYADDEVLARHVGLFLKEGVDRGEWMIVIATPSHVDAFQASLRLAGVDVEDLLRSTRLTVLDAEDTLARILVDGKPDWKRFDDHVGRLIRATRARAGNSRIRAYGEMVDLLWKSGWLGAATQLEEHWNTLLQTHPFALYCAYSLDILDKDVVTGSLHEMIRTHSHLLPVRSNGELEHAVDKALVDVLGPATAGAIMPLVRATRYPRVLLPPAEATVLWLRNHLPPYAHEVLARARTLYEAECARTSVA